jgi:hypothetical protein
MRGASEFNTAHIKGRKGTIYDNLNLIPKDKQLVVIHCQGGTDLQLHILF